MAKKAGPALILTPESWKLWAEVRGLLQQGTSNSQKVSASKLVKYFTSANQAFGFRAPSAPDGLSLDKSKKAEETKLSEFQTMLGAAAHASVEAEQLVSRLCRSISNLDSILDGPPGQTVETAEVRLRLAEVKEVLDASVSHRIGNTVRILAAGFANLTNQRRDLWGSASQDLVLAKSEVPPSEAALFGLIGHSLRSELSLC